MSGLAAGRLRDRVRLEAPDQQPNGQGGRRPTPGTDGWSPVVTLRAEVIGLRGQEAVRNNIERATQLWKVTIRERADVTTAHRLVLLPAGTVLNIRSIMPDPDTRGAQILMGESGMNGAGRR